MIKLVVTGSESTGKTELARRLAAHFGVPLSEEFVRAYAARRAAGEGEKAPASAETAVALSFSDHGPIAKGQMALEDAAIAVATGLVVLDTDLVSTVVYCGHYFGVCPPWIEAMARERAASLYLLLKPDIPWIADGVRDRGDRREEMHALFARTLRDLGVRSVEIGGAGDDRFAAALRAITTSGALSARER